MSRKVVSGFSRAQDLVYDGWELMDSDISEARRCFKEAIVLDPELSDAYNGLASIAAGRGNLADAERYYRTAYEKAKAFLGTEDPSAFGWWGELETRPYMRSRHGLGLVLLDLERYDEAISLFKDLLHRNPNDNQGIRYLLAPAYLQKGDIPGALMEFDRYKRLYRRDMPEPHFLLNWGLALFLGGRFEEAAVAFRSTFFVNPYLLPLVLRMKPRVLSPRHSTNYMELDYARDYFQHYGRLWSGRHEARRFVEFLWKDHEVKSDFREWRGFCRERDKHGPSPARSVLIDKMNRVESKGLPPAFFMRMRSFLFSAKRPS